MRITRSPAHALHRNTQPVIVRALMIAIAQHFRERKRIVEYTVLEQVSMERSKITNRHDQAASVFSNSGLSLERPGIGNAKRVDPL
jgi:hypothetical protein